MRLIAGFLRLVRLPNLVFIALTQILFQYCIFRPLFNGAVPAGDTARFILLVIASVLIAAAGYIINDYFDINIDEINKPGKMVIDKIINRRWALAWHLLLSGIGVVLTFIAVPFRQLWYLVLANMACVALLWFYSTTFKKKLLIGNIIIALLTAWTILIIFFSKFSLADAFGAVHEGQAKFFRFTFLYAGFAFICSVIREAIKDMEDIHGDARYGCRTMPIVWGINVTKVYVAIWLIILIALLVIVQAYILQFRWWAAVVYCILFILLPAGYIFRSLYGAKSQHDFHRLSSWTKTVILTGILSMAFFYFYL